MLGYRRSATAHTDNPTGRRSTYAFGFLATLAGLVLGIIEIAYRIAGNAVSVGTVVLIALLLISGSQFTLFAMWFDMESNKDLR